MALIRLVLLLLAVGSVTLLLLQNQTPSLPLVFLGMQTQAWPMAVWLVAAIVLGVLTSIVLAGLSQLATYWESRAWRSRLRQQSRQSFGFTYRPAEANRTQSFSTPAAKTDSDEDWLEDWEEDREFKPSRTTVADAVKRPAPAYEVPQEPQSRYQSGSVYSYSYRQSPKSEPKPEPEPEPEPMRPPKEQQAQPPQTPKPRQVVDADFRVIVPPPPPAAAPENDWEFEDDQDNDRSRKDDW